MTSDDMDLGAFQINAQDESHEFGKQMSIRESARRAVHRGRSFRKSCQSTFEEGIPNPQR